MGLRERDTKGKVTEYPDGAEISRARLASSFGCSTFAIERIFKRASVVPTIKDTPTGAQPFINVDLFPRIIQAIKTGPRPHEKLRDIPIDTSGEFTIQTTRGVVFSYTPSPSKQR